MTTSSAQPNSSDDLFDDIPISGDIVISTADTMIGNITIPTYSGTGSYIASTDTITLTGAGAGGIYTISTGDTITLNTDYNFNWGDAQEWVDSFPDWQRVQDMCKKYPGLEIALRNFQTIYTLVKDDYDNPKDED